MCSNKYPYKYLSIDIVQKNKKSRKKGKKSQLFCHFSLTTSFPNKIFYQTNTFLQAEVKVQLEDKFLECHLNSYYNR